MDSLETLIIREQQSFELHNQLNPVQITINNDRVLNILKKHENSYYKLTPIGLLFSSSVQNDTKQIFATCRELNDVKVALINAKISNILRVINLNKIANQEYIKGKALWRNINFNSLEEVKSIEHFCFPFKTLPLNDMLSFSIYFIDDNNKPIEFTNDENEISILNFKTDIFSK